MGVIKKLSVLFSPRPELIPEQAEAYFHKLPDSVQVSIEREGNFIVGTILTNDDEYVTQGKTGEEFVHMVNDCIYTVYGVKPEYRLMLNRIMTFIPEDAGILKELNMRSSKLHDFSLVKKRVTA